VAYAQSFLTYYVYHSVSETHLVIKLVRKRQMASLLYLNSIPWAWIVDIVVSSTSA